MKQRQKASVSQSGAKLQSFAGETVSNDGKNQKVSFCLICIADFVFLECTKI